MNSSKTGFDAQKAIFYAAVCSQTYMQYSQNGIFIVPTDYDVVGTIEARSFGGELERFGFVLESDRDIVVAFRGTSSTDDWISDAIASQEPYRWAKGYGMAHRGFSQIYASARERLLGILDRLPADKRLFIVGHSLGGALATLCAPDVAAHSKYRAPKLYTYGAPRAGDPTFAKATAAGLPAGCRIYNVYDTVPHLPPLIFKVPKKDKWYYYAHVRRGVQLEFQNGSVSANHVISSYFRNLAAMEPEYTMKMCAYNPGFCP